MIFAGVDAAHPARHRVGQGVGRVAVALVFVVLAVHWVVELRAAMLQDLDVYLAAARDIVAGRDPYAARAALPYTYPPAWAAICVPLTLVPVWLAKTLVFVSSLAVAVALVWRLCRARTRPWLWAGAAMFAAPISRTLYQGQVNLLLTALVLLDYFALSARTRGMGTGLAAAIKLTPAFMTLPLLLRKDWWGVLRAAGTFLLLSAVTFAVWPAPSREYWTELVWDSSRVGGVEYADNQSLLAALSRLVGTDAGHQLWLIVIFPVLALTVWAVVRQVRGGTVLGQIAAAGIGASLLSPVSWSHHWVWLIIASAVIASWGRERLAVIVLLPLVFEPAWVANLLPSALPHLVGAALLALTPGVGMLCLTLLARTPRPSASTPLTPSPPALKQAQSTRGRPLVT